MKIAIFTENSELQSVKRLQAEAKNLNIDLDLINPFDSVINTYDSQTNPYKFILHRTSGIRFDDYEIALALKYQNSGSTIVNPIQSLHFLRDKLMQHIQLSNNGVSMVPTYAFRGRAREDLINTISKIHSLLPFKSTNQDQFIIKMARGNHGVGVNLINETESLSGILETFWAINDQRLLIQPYIDQATEYRVFFCDKKIIAALKRFKSPGEFRLNAGRGDAQAIKVKDLPKVIFDNCEKAIVASGCHYGGIDILEKDNFAFVLELNQVPGFQQMEDLTNINIAKAILQSLDKE